jgi:hypothetical protein
MIEAGADAGHPGAPLATQPLRCTKQEFSNRSGGAYLTDRGASFVTPAASTVDHSCGSRTREWPQGGGVILTGCHLRDVNKSG